MSDVFVSYKSEDRLRVKPLVDALELDGLSVWWDVDIGTGDEWRETIERQLDAARCVVVVWSKRTTAAEGRFVRDEATRAQRRGVYVPVLIDAVDPPLGFGETQATSLRLWRGDRSDPAYLAVLSTVRRIVGTSQTPAASPPAARAAINRRAVVAGAGIAAVAGAGGWALMRRKPVVASDSIAVLPFANLSGDPAQVYFSDGIAEELRSTLARLPGVHVVGRTSSEAVRNESTQSAARKLGVENVLIGSVRQSTSTIRVSAQLVDGRSGLEKWSNSYDRPPGDAIKIQSDIASNVASTLSAALGEAARAAMAIGGTDNADAQRLVLEASEISRDQSEAAIKRALQLVERAIQLDPKYADAYARRSGFLTVLTDYFETDTSQYVSGRVEALRMANIAIRLAPRLPRAHLALASIQVSSFQLAPAWRQYQRALELGPSEAPVLRGYSAFLGQLGRFSKALDLADKAIAADPLGSASYNVRVRILYYARRYEEVIEYSRQLPPHYIDVQQLLARCLMMAGHLEQARRAYAKAPDDLVRRTYEAVLAARGGDRGLARSLADRIRRDAGESASYQLAQIFAQLGQTGDALTSLERAWAIKDPGLLISRVDPILDPIRNEPRFEAVLKEINFP